MIVNVVRLTPQNNDVTLQQRFSQQHYGVTRLQVIAILAIVYHGATIK